MTDSKEKIIIEKIKNNYVGKTTEQTKLEEIKSLDKKVKNPARIFAYTFGTIGSLVLGTGMCLAMKVIGDLMALGIVVGIIGIILVLVTYPIYKKILARRKEKYGNEIISKSNEILNS